MWLSVILLAIFWLLYGLLHSALATSTCKDFVLSKLRFGVNAYRLLYNIVAIVSLLPLIYFGFLVRSHTIFGPNEVTTSIGFVVLLAGVMVMCIIIKKYFASMNGVEDVKDDLLITTGLHSYIRHPLYSGTFLLLIAVFLLSPKINILTSCITIIIYTIFAVRWEEAKLISKLGEQYKIYCAITPRFIPRLFARKQTKKII